LKSHLRQHVQVLAGLIGERNTNRPSGLDAARSYITRQLTEMGLDVTPQHYQVPTRPAMNLLVRLAGSKPSLPALVVGAHYDTAPGTPGADDNASAVAALIEIIRAIHNRKLRRTVCCVFYDCEEPPHFATKQMGSFQHAKSLRENGQSILGMICLESIGYFPRRVDSSIYRPWYIRWADQIFGGRTIVIVSNLRSIPFGLPFVVRLITSGFFKCIPAALPGDDGPHALSDNRGYWHHGYRALMVTNTAMFRNPNYHLRSDLPDTLDYDRSARVTRMLSRAIRRTCGGR
jgi:hypothetical protein